MKTTLVVVTVLALGALAGCDRKPEQRTSATTPPSQEEKKDGANPVQGQVDPKQAEQHKDFQQRGDSAGPRGPDTQPKTGG